MDSAKKTSLSLGFITVFVILGSLLNRANASQLPDQIEASLQQREERLQHSTFAWQIVLQQSEPSKPKEQVVEMKRAIELQLPGQLRKEGIVDDNVIHKQVEEAQRQVLPRMRGFSYTSTNMWRFVRYGTQTLVTGTKELGDSRVGFAQYYDGNSGLIANTGTYIGKAKSLRNEDPNIWASSGDSIRYRSLFQQSLGLLPEHYAMLLGLNPLSMYGAKWHLVSTTPTEWILQAQVSQNDFAPFTIQLLLDRSHTGAPVQLKLHSKDETINFQVKGFQRVGNDWVANHIVFSDRWLGYLTTNQDWTLQNVTQSKPIVITLSQKQFVHDYRLLGPNLTIRGLYPVVNKQQQESIIYYRWPGHFPSDEELKRMYQKQSPGEASPDMGQARASSSTSVANITGSALPFAGGVLCLAGGVWMFKQRKAN